MLRHTVALAALCTLVPTSVAAAHSAGASHRGTVSTARYRLVGFTGSGRLVFNDISHDRIYAVNRDGSGLRLPHRKAKATSVVGRLVEFRSEAHAITRRHYLDTRTGAGHVLPRNWTWLTEGGGLRLARESDGVHLRYLPIGGRALDWGALTSVPRNGADIRVTASADGRSFRDGLDCRALTATISCTDIIGYPHRDVIGVDPTGAEAPAVHKVSRRLGDVTFESGAADTYAYTTLAIARAAASSTWSGAPPSTAPPSTGRNSARPN